VAAELGWSKDEEQHRIETFKKSLSKETECLNR
jgi:hypothetical protein